MPSNPKNIDTPASLAGRVAIITGACGGIGAAVARGFAASGCRLVITDLPGRELDRLEAELSDQGSRVLSLAADVTRPDEVEAVVNRAVSEFGNVDVLFNNAGIGVRKAFLDTSLDEWDQVISVNLKGAFLVAQAVARIMAGQGSGSIINTASIVSFVGRNNVSVYSASKAGLHALTRCMAMELGPYNVRVNSIAPGMVYSPFTAPFLDADQGRRKASIGSTIPLGRVAVPDDLVGAVLYLASDAALYVTGASITIDGGWTAGTFTNDEGWTTG